MLTGGLLQSCMRILIVICISTVTKGLLLGVKLGLCLSCCIYYKLLTQLGYISVLGYILTCFFGQILLTLFTSLAVVLFAESIPENIESCPSDLFCRRYPQLMDLASFQINLEVRLL